jgi:hypothetical protein
MDLNEAMWWFDRFDELPFPDDLETPYTGADYIRAKCRQVLLAMPQEERLARIPIEERLAGLSVEELLKGLSFEQRMAGLTPQQRLAGLSAQEIMAALPPKLRKVVRESIPPE